jgi:phage-related protein
MGGYLDKKENVVVCGKVENWLNKIENSRLSIYHQLDRIYLHRNQIVHSGKFINEYSNMWSHLEWYVGKLITYGYVYHYKSSRSDFSKKEAFLKLEGEVEHIKNILEINRDKKISEIEEQYSTVFRLIWQYF